MLFADLSGYTGYAEQTDPEAVKQLLDRTLRKLGEEVTRFGGSVDKYIGDNVMAVFGAPVAHEDDPERAVRAGLAMQETMERLNDKHAPQSDVNFMLRVGINTGEVLAGRMGDGYTVIGDTVNVAARLQAAARPGTVTVGRSTFARPRASIAYTELEPLTLKGKAEPVPAWEAKALLAEGPVHRAEPRTAAPLIGRAEESGLLLRLAERVSTEQPPAPGHRDRPGRGRQVAPAARVPLQPRRPAPRSQPAHRRVPALRDQHLLLGPGRGDPRRVRDRRRRADGQRLAEAPRRAWPSASTAPGTRSRRNATRR